MTIRTGQTITRFADVARREIGLEDSEGRVWVFRNAPAFNMVRLIREGRSAVGTTFDAAAAGIGTSTGVLHQVLDAIWEEAVNSQGPPPGPGPQDPGIPPAPPEPGMPLPSFPDPPFPGPIPEPPGGGTMEPVLLSSLGAGIAIVIAIASQVIRGPLTRGLLLRWQSLPGWAQTVLSAIGFTAGADILFDMGPGDEGWIDVPNIFPGLPDIPGLPVGGGGGGDPIGQMVEAMTVSTWNANGVQFHRLSDGRLAVRNKHGVWKIWRPKKPIVLMPSGQADLKDLVRAENVLDKQFKKLAKSMRNRGYSVSRK